MIAIIKGIGIPHLREEASAFLYQFLRSRNISHKLSGRSGGYRCPQLGIKKIRHKKINKRERFLFRPPIMSLIRHSPSIISLRASISAPFPSCHCLIPMPESEEISFKVFAFLLSKARSSLRSSRMRFPPALNPILASFIVNSLLAIGRLLKDLS